LFRRVLKLKTNAGRGIAVAGGASLFVTQRCPWPLVFISLESLILAQNERWQRG